MNSKIGPRCVCLIVGCRRSTAVPYTEWLCPRHWSLVPKETRRVYARAKRHHKSQAVLDRLWSRACRLAKNAVKDDLFGP